MIEEALIARDVQDMATSLGNESVMQKASVASLTHQQIEEMDREDLIEAIRAIPTISARTQQLEFASRDTLERMVYLVRRCCRQQGY